MDRKFIDKLVFIHLKDGKLLMTLSRGIVGPVDELIFDDIHGKGLLL
jgi:hypothetical protein